MSSRWLLRHGGRAKVVRPQILILRRRQLSSSRSANRDDDPRFRDLGRLISDDFAAIREKYATPKHPIVLAHGLLGFSSLQIAPPSILPPILYWQGIQEALTANRCTVITASVPPSGSIEERAAKLGADILAQVTSRADSLPDDGEQAQPSQPLQDAIPTVNIIAHSMGGLDARYLISRLKPLNLKVASLVTLASPHRGSPFADYLVEKGGGPIHLPRLYGIIRRAGLGTKAFGQLTTRYMRDEFNPTVQDDASVRYFSYGASMGEPGFMGAFRLPYQIIERAEGANDGLVSVASSRWGTYKGTLMGVSHLDLINWSNKVGWTVREWMGIKRKFNAVAFYLDVADMLAKEGL